MEPQPGTGAPNSADYQFIFSPQQPKKSFSIGFIKDPFIAKIILLVGGALVLMIVSWLAVVLFFSGKSNVDTFVALAQREEEIVRVGKLGEDASSQQIKNAAINTMLSVKSYQNKSIAYLAAHGREVKADDLALKKDVVADGQLKEAKENSTFDTVYAKIARGQLEAYANELKAAYDNESGDEQRQMLAARYEGAQLLLQQWPEESN